MNRLGVLLITAAALAHLDASAARLPGAPTFGFPVLRFHHLHLKVADPASAMSALAEKVQGTRMILQGFGVGVRSGDQYVLFDRADSDPATKALDGAEQYRRAAAWLRERGATVEPSDLPGPASAAMEF